MTNDEFAAQLEALAAIYRQHPDIPQLYYLADDFGSPEFVFCHSKETFTAAVRAFGPGTKSADDDSLIFTPDAFPTIRINGFKNEVCERVQVGTRIVPQTIIPAVKAEPERIVAEHEEPVYEWRCAPFLETPERKEAA